MPLVFPHSRAGPAMPRAARLAEKQNPITARAPEAPSSSRPAVVSTTASLLVAQTALSPVEAAGLASVASNFLLDSTFLVFAAPIPLFASVFLAWLTRLPAQPIPSSHQRHARHSQAIHNGKPGHGPQPQLRRQGCLMIMAHTLLIATSLNLLLTATLGLYKTLDHIDILSLASAPETHTPFLGKQVALGVLNGIASITAQTMGETAMIYQFSRIYPSSSARWRILPVAFLVILVRLVAHIALNVFVTWSMINPSVARTLEPFAGIAATCFSSSVTAITLLLSATFVYKLSSRWRRHVASGRNSAKFRGRPFSATQLPPTTQRIRGILVASWHHTVLTSIFSVAMTASFPFDQSSRAAHWINLVATTAFKISFALGISRSLYHMAYDSVSRHRIHFLATGQTQLPGTRGGLRRNQEERPRTPGQWHDENLDTEIEGVDCLSLSSSAASSFMYNSWGSADSDSDSDGGRRAPDSITEAGMNVDVDTAIPLSEWPIATEDIESVPLASDHGHALPLSPAAAEGSSKALSKRASLPRPLGSSQSSRPLTVPPLWDTFVLSQCHLEPWPIRSSVIESDPGHSIHGAPSHPTCKATAAPDSSSSSQCKRPNPPKHINLAMNSLRGPQEVVDHFSEYVCHRFATNAQFFPASLVRESLLGSTTTAVSPTAASAAATENDSAATLPGLHPPPTAPADSRNSHDNDPPAQQPKLAADHVPGARMCYQTMMEVLAPPPLLQSAYAPFSSRRAVPTRPKGSAKDDAPNKAKSKPVLFLPVHFNGRKLGVFILAPWDPPGRVSKSFGAQNASSSCNVVPDGRRTRSRHGSQQQSDSGAQPVSEQLDQGPFNDPAIELVKQLVRFFAAYYYSALERQLNEETMRKFQDRLTVMEATADAKSTFLANMSHEIRTPAAQVIQAVHMLSETDLNSIQREHVQVIIRSSELLLAILNDVLDLSKLENGKIRFENRPFDLHEAVRQSVDAYTNPRKPVDVGCVIDRALPQYVVGDVVRLRQIFNNLLSNAVKFTTVGHVLLRTTLVSMDSTSARVRFSVQDTGCGIPQDRLVSIFERFEQSDETITRLYGGTGLGLSICQSLCSLMSSSLEVTSELNRGSDFSFEVSLPFAPPDHIVPPHLLAPPPPILDPTVRPRLVRLVICTETASHRPSQSPPTQGRGAPSGSVATGGSATLHSSTSRPHDVMNDLLANYGIVVATIYTSCNALMDTANAMGTGPEPNVVVMSCPKRWPPIPATPPRLPTVIVSGCDMLASPDDGPTLVPPRSPYANLAFVARPFKQSHLYRVLDSVAGIGDTLPPAARKKESNGHNVFVPGLVAEPPPDSLAPDASHVILAPENEALTCANSSSESPVAHHSAPSVIASDLSSTAHATAGSGSVAGGYAPLRVLVVDDNPLNRKLMQAMVAKLGHEVELAENGKVAVDRVLGMTAGPGFVDDSDPREGCREPNDDDADIPFIDCIFMDVRMPVLDGLEATRLIVSHFDSLTDPALRAKRPVIFGLSADAMQESEQTGLFHGMDVYLRKPLLRKDIEAALNQFFGPNGSRQKKH